MNYDALQFIYESRMDYTAFNEADCLHDCTYSSMAVNEREEERKLFAQTSSKTSVECNLEASVSGTQFHLRTGSSKEPRKALRINCTGNNIGDLW